MIIKIILNILVLEIKDVLNHMIIIMKIILYLQRLQNRLFHFSVIINDKGKIAKLIDSCYYFNKNIRIFNFNFGELLKRIDVYDYNNGLCL